MTDAERDNIENEIAVCSQLLNQTDYKCLKYAEGALIEEEYTATKAQRAAWRAKINELQEKLASL